jgi:hypothetical protein
VGQQTESLTVELRHLDKKSRSPSLTQQLLLTVRFSDLLLDAPPAFSHLVSRDVRRDIDEGIGTELWDYRCGRTEFVDSHSELLSSDSQTATQCIVDPVCFGCRLGLSNANATLPPKHDISAQDVFVLSRL